MSRQSRQVSCSLFILALASGMNPGPTLARETGESSLGADIRRLTLLHSENWLEGRSENWSESSPENRNDTRDPQIDSVLPFDRQIEGTVYFESRYTRVHDNALGVKHPDTDDTLDDGSPAKLSPLKPELYWAVVIVSGGSRYLLSDRIHTGNPLPPEEVELEGVTLKVGDSVSIKGKIVTVDPRYFVFLDVEEITLLAG